MYFLYIMYEAVNKIIRKCLETTVLNIYYFFYLKLSVYFTSLYSKITMHTNE